MSKSLIIVESPAKTKTLKNFLGEEYSIEASMGHVRDLPKNQLGVDVGDGFKPKYVSIPERRTVLSHLKKAVSGAKQVYLATDPDREGEAIAWHLEQALKIKDAKRIEFNEITKSAVKDALDHPREVNEDLVDAQQARRVLDRLVGYKLSPLLWSKVKKGLSAGRVQSVAVRLVCDRERQILAFVPEEYWSVTARLAKDDKTFSAKLIEKAGKKIKLGVEADAKRVLAELEGASYTVSGVKEREQKRNPAAPFITSTLQQEASRKLGFSNKKTMSVAQTLYEGVGLGSEGSVGLITYMRTDSTRVAGEAVSQAREFILSEYGKEFVPASPRQYKSKKSAQDAHEAVRPTSVLRRPKDIDKFLSRDQARLYRLIWQRFLASQMASLVMDIVTVDISAADYTFRATGSTVKFPGFTVLYTEGRDASPGQEEEEEEGQLPKLSKDDVLRLIELLPKQHFTEPPSRYTEATLVKALEEKGIGRPSTYAAIISTIIDRKYVELEEKKFKPTDLGFTVTDLLVKHFPKVMGEEFTAEVETELDEVAEGDIDWEKVISRFWEPFAKSLEDAKANMESLKTPPQETGEACPNCGKPLVIRESRYGKFLGCSGYPKCKTVVSRGAGEACPVPGCGGEMVETSPGSGRLKCSHAPQCQFVSRTKVQEGEGAEGAPGETESAGICPNCGKPLVRRQGRYGEFLGCSGYPKCKTIISQPKPVGVKCPTEGCTGDIIERRSKHGKLFYGCSRYPDCSFVSWNKPLDRKCPKCSSVLVEKQYRGKSQGIACSSESCDYKEPPEAETE
ncbi:MAG: type I DNA topoisomerase [Armatimonadota bacterium]|jgi:DNA topoisomerase-1